MTGVGVVEPVVVVADEVGTTLALHTEHVGLAGIPVAAVAHGDVFGVGFHVDGTVALHVVAASLFAIEYIDVMNPDVRVVGVE